MNNRDAPLASALLILGIGLFANVVVLTGPNWRTVSAEGWIAGFTAMLFASTTALWLATRRSIIEARQNGQQQLRAYVCVRGASLKTIGPRRIPVAKIELENSGLTPAYEFRAARRMAVREYPLEESPLSAFTEQEAWPRRVLGPRSEQFPEISLERALTAAENAEIENSTKAIYVWGVAYYADAFRQPRETKYCLVVTGARITDATEVMSVYHAGNTAT